jgi:type II secretory pathway component PulM
MTDGSQGQTANLGCGTLILIALIVMIFTRPATEELEREVQRLTTDVGQLREAVDKLRDDVGSLRPGLHDVQQLAGDIRQIRESVAELRQRNEPPPE